MTETELLNWIKRETGKTKEEIEAFCDFNGMTLSGYKEYVERAKAARAKPVPKDYPNAIIVDPKIRSTN